MPIPAANLPSINAVGIANVNEDKFTANKKSRKVEWRCGAGGGGVRHGKFRIARKQASKIVSVLN
jgi:hypothetical protein